MLSLDVPQSVASRIVSQDAFVRKLYDEFTTDEQRMFVDSFTVYLGHDSNAFVVDLDDAVTWLGFSRRDAALRTVRGKMAENVDYRAIPQESGIASAMGGRKKEHHMLTVDAFKMLCMLAGTTQGATVRRYYLKMESVLMKHLTESHSTNTPATPDEVGLLEANRNARRRLIAGGVESYASAARISVQMVVGELVQSGRVQPSVARDNAHLARGGSAIAKIFKGRQNSGEINSLPDGTGYELTWTGSGEDPVRIQNVTSEIMSLCRMRHASAYGLQEVHTRTVYNPWTYPAAFKIDMERVMCAEFGIPVVMRAALARTSPWG
jgi:phage anti-repressor protein